MGSYTLLTLVAVVVVVALELAWMRTGVFGMSAYWIAISICFGFQIVVDGWLTKLSSPVVLYSSASFSGVRLFWDSPAEDFGFGFALMTLVIALWIRAGRDDPDSSPTG